MRFMVKVSFPVEAAPAVLPEDLHKAAAAIDHAAKTYG